MTSNGKKFTLNFTSTSRFLKKRAGSNGSGQDSDKRSGNSLWLSPGGGSGSGRHGDASPLALQRSSSTGDMELSPDCGGVGGGLPLDGSPCPSVDGDDPIVTLTCHVQRFSNALGALKSAICSPPPECVLGEVQTEVQRRLDDVVCNVKELVHKYPSLHSADILLATSALVDSCKQFTEDLCNFDNEVLMSEFLADVNHLAHVVTGSVSEYWMADSDSCHSMVKTKSLDCLLAVAAAAEASTKDSAAGRDPDGTVHQLVGDGLDAVLHRLESGVEIALTRAQAWSKYIKDLVSYVERRSSMWAEFARNAQKLAKSVQQSINEDSFLPFQSIYSKALSQDTELATLSQAARTLIQNQTFVAPLNARRAEHDKVRKNIKYAWTKQVRKMHDAVANLRKARSAYIGRQHEYEKTKELVLKAETESLSLSSTGGPVAAKADARTEKKKKQEDEALQKAVEAEATYKLCVEEANFAQHQLVQVKRAVLRDVRQLLDVSDKELKVASENYFKLMNTITDTIPQQFLSLSDSCKSYEPGSHYADYVRQLRPADNPVAVVEPFIFEPYLVSGRFGDSLVSDALHESFTHSGKSQDSRGGSGGGGGGGGPPRTAFRLEDSDSVSGGSSLSLESSPTTSPYQGHHHRAAPAALSIGGDGGTEGACAAHGGGDDEHKFDLMDDSGATFRGIRLSGAAQTHSLRKLRAPSRCRECDSFVYFQGAECDKCGVASHKKCLEVLRAVCTTPSAVGMATPYVPEMFEVPELVKKCIREINRRGMGVKGIYRVSGVKSKVEQVCYSFDTDEGSVNLSNQHPNVIANVLKLYLRQLPEPLLTFKLYPMLIQLAKDDLQSPSGVGLLTTLTSLMEQLPLFNYKTCVALMHHLKRVTKHQEVNQMSASNLGIVFGPTLLRPKEGPGCLDYLIDTPYQTRTIEILIENVQTIFGAEDTSGADCGADSTSDPPGGDPSDNPEGAISPTITTWYAPEMTHDLLQELAQEGPHFQQLQQSGSLRQTSNEGPVFAKPDDEPSMAATTTGAVESKPSAESTESQSQGDDSKADKVYFI